MLEIWNKRVIGFLGNIFSVSIFELKFCLCVRYVFYVLEWDFFLVKFIII